MNTKLLLIALVIGGLSSCSTAYKIGQTPDDVYYSPAPPQNDYVQVNNEEDKPVYNNPLPEDRGISRPMHSRRWRKRYYDNDYPYGYNYPYGAYPNGTNYPVYTDPKTGTTYTAPRKSNLKTYTNPPVTNYTLDPKTGKITPAATPAVTTTSGNPARTFEKPQRKPSAFGNFIRKVLTPSDSYSNTNDNTTTQSRSAETRTTNNNNTSSSSASKSASTSTSSSGNAPVRTFKR